MSELLVLQSSPEFGSDWETRNSAIRFVSWSQSKGNLWDHHDQHPPISVHFLRLQTMDHRRLEQVVDAGWNFRNQCSIAAAILWWRFASLSALRLSSRLCWGKPQWPWHPWGGFPSQENSRTQIQQLEVYAESKQGKDKSARLPRGARIGGGLVLLVPSIGTNAVGADDAGRNSL